MCATEPCWILWIVAMVGYGVSQTFVALTIYDNSPDKHMRQFEAYVFSLFWPLVIMALIFTSLMDFVTGKRND